MSRRPLDRSLGVVFSRPMILPLLLASALAPPAAAASPPTKAREPREVYQYAGVVISPDAGSVASVDTAPGASPTVVVRRAADGAVIARYQTCAKCDYGAPTWSSDGARIAFVANDRATGSAAVMIARPARAPGAAADTPALVVKMQGLLASPRWSPDGGRIALLATANPKKLTGATQPGAAQVGEIGSSPDEQRIAVVAASGGDLRFISPADTFVYEYDWSPDGRGFVGTAAKGDGDNNWWVAKLEAFSLDGAERVIAAPKMQMNYPRVSPDGKTVAFIGGLMSDFGSIGGDVWTVPAAGGDPRDLTPGYKGTFTSLVWRGQTVRAAALAGDHAQTVRIDPATGGIKAVDGPQASFGAGDGRVSFSADGETVAATVQDFETAPRILVHAGTGAPHVITHDNDALTPNVAAKSITWKHDGFDGQGWLATPRTLTPGKRYPMIVLVHGGPSAAATPAYVSRGTVKDLVDHGYFVFQPNPRGSYGQGEAYVAANKRDFGGGDLGDILAGVDAAEKVAPIDDARLGVTGHSYGGFMTMWTVTHSTRFKAAAAGAGLSNWSSYYGENGIDQWMLPFFGKSFYEDPAIYDKLSPIRYVKDAKTPTLIYVGERDVECPPGQSVEFWHGLKEYGVPTTLVIYAGEGHGISKPADRQDITTRTLAWFDKYLGAPGA